MKIYLVCGYYGSCFYDVIKAFKDLDRAVQ